jgi:hypothetical protein
MFIRIISFIVKVLSMAQHAREIRPVLSKFPVGTTCNAANELIHQRTFLSNTLAHKVNVTCVTFLFDMKAFASFLVHTMCVDTTPLRNTLYGFIVSPAYPHPMADNLKCSISIGMIAFFARLITGKRAY